MRTNAVKHKLASGQTVLGTALFEFHSTGIGRVADEAGAEFLFIDMEHTGWSEETIKMLIATTRSRPVVPLVRVPAATYPFVARVLDMGAMGIIVPMMESVDQARILAESGRYPPVGRRGAAFAIAHDDYAGGDVAEKIRSANAEVLVIAQIETAAGLQNVEAIAAVPGIDLLWVGQFDLSISLGIPGQFDSPEFVAALERIVAAANRHGKAAGFMVLSPEEASLRHAQGFRCLAYNGDLWLYQHALRSGLHEIRERLGAGG